MGGSESIVDVRSCRYQAKIAFLQLKKMPFFAYKLVAFASVLKYRSHLSVSMLRIYNELYARVTVTDILSPQWLRLK